MITDPSRQGHVECRVIFVCIWYRVYLLGCRLARGTSQGLTSVILVIADWIITSTTTQRHRRTHGLKHRSNNGINLILKPRIYCFSFIWIISCFKSSAKKTESPIPVFCMNVWALNIKTHGILMTSSINLSSIIPIHPFSSQSEFKL